MAIAISHCLALCKLAACIIILENSQIIEQGTHQELMTIKGHEYSMFSQQASSYK